MGQYEDLFLDVYYELEKLNLREEFLDQLSKMSNQEKHRYKSYKEKYEYAFSKVTNRKTP